MEVNLIAFLLALSVALSIATAAPSNDLAAAPAADGSIVVPHGSVVVGQVIGGAFRLVALTPEEADPLTAPMMGGQGDMKACDNDIQGGGLHYWAPVSTVPWWGLEGTNTASKGECVEETHSGPISLMQFRTAGDYYGSVYAEGCNGGECGWYQVGCHPVGTATGFPDHEGWGTLMRGRDTTCTWSSHGPQPHEWAEWKGYVGNAHYWEGSASVTFI